MRKGLFFILFCVGLLSACNLDKNTKVDQTSIDFKTDDSSRLFFKNLRQSYYDLEKMEEAKLEIYRLKKRVVDTDQPVINLAIVNNWRYDEAYILLEPNSLIPNSNKISIHWINENGSEGEILFAGGNKKDLLNFAGAIYEQIQAGSTFQILLEGKKVDILIDTKSREAFRVTMFDYYRLVRQF